jgi:hypothetical protein
MPCSERKHTPIVSEAQRRFVGAVQTYQKTGKGSIKVAEAAKTWPSKGHSSPGAHLKEVKGKDLVSRTRKRLKKIYG